MTHKHTLLTAALAAITLLPMQAQEPDKSHQMAEYAKGCQKLLDGIAHKDKYALYEAKEDFAKVSMESIAPECKDGSKGEEKPDVLFCQEYADALIKNNFLKTKLDDISIMRNADDSDILVFHKAVDAHGVLNYEWEGSGKCELMLVTTQAEKVKVTVTDKASGKQYTAKPDEKGNINYVAWNMGDADSSYSIRIENLTDKRVSFVVALN